MIKHDARALSRTHYLAVRPMTGTVAYPLTRLQITRGSHRPLFPFFPHTLSCAQEFVIPRGGVLCCRAKCRLLILVMGFDASGYIHNGHPTTVNRKTRVLKLEAPRSSLCYATIDT